VEGGLGGLRAWAGSQFVLQFANGSLHRDLPQRQTRPAAGDCGAGLREHLRAQTHEPIYLTQQSISGCTMEVVRNGAQYRKNLRFWGAPVAPKRVENPIPSVFSP